MLPSAVIALERMPVTANGKLDRAALPAPDAVNAPRTRRAPTDAAERHLLAIWESLFGRDGLSTDDDFFAIGGHSLLAVRLVDAIERTFGVRLPLDTFWFRGNTIRDIAGLLRGAGGVDLRGGRQRGLEPRDRRRRRRVRRHDRQASRGRPWLHRARPVLLRRRLHRLHAQLRVETV